MAENATRKWLEDHPEAVGRAIPLTPERRNYFEQEWPKATPLQGSLDIFLKDCVEDSINSRPPADVRVVGDWNSESAAAAVRIKPAQGAQQTRILEWLAEHPLSTDDEIAEGARIGPSSIRPRLRELAGEANPGDAVFVVVADKDGKTKAGNSARRWRLA